MTEKLYDKDSHLKEFTARVISSEKTERGWETVLESTAFFPEGGGQGSDRGVLGSATVTDVQMIDGKIIHITDRPLTQGTEVKGVIDWERRFDFMQQHSAEHIVSGVAHKLYGCENVGFHLSEDIVTLDFDKPLSFEDIARIERLANQAVFKNAAVKTYYPTEDDLKEIKYRSKKEIDGAVRIVEIDGIDICACCAPHVNFTGEIGIIKLLGSEALRGGVRLELKAGLRAFEDYAVKHENVRKISAQLCVKQNEAANAVAHTLDSVSQLKGQIADLKRKLTALKTEYFCPKKSITAEFEEGLDIKELQAYADALYKKTGGIRAVFSPNQEGFAFAICGEENELCEFFKNFKNEFTVKGGGRNGMVQGTVIADKEKIKSRF